MISLFGDYDVQVSEEDKASTSSAIPASLQSRLLSRPQELVRDLIKRATVSKKCTSTPTQQNGELLKCSVHFLDFLDDSHHEFDIRVRGIAHRLLSNFH